MAKYCRSDKCQSSIVSDLRKVGAHVLSIESDSLSGIENISDYRDTVIECAHNILTFIGPAKPQEVGEAANTATNSQSDAMPRSACAHLADVVRNEKL